MFAQFQDILFPPPIWCATLRDRKWTQWRDVLWCLKSKSSKLYQFLFI